ncbi:hypothetical protein GCM10022267_13990 [Lentzea roselyniae]|uniref:Uncharacterized protein n=1 Tax=Lentzea roselyniae TaxID=531940 RepID=A0ABP7ABG9_9PSEU
MAALVSFLIVTVAVYPVSQDCLENVAVTPAALAGARLTITVPSTSAATALIRANNNMAAPSHTRWRPAGGLLELD